MRRGPLLAALLSLAPPVGAAEPWPDLDQPLQTWASSPDDWAVIIGNGGYPYLKKSLPEAHRDADAVMRTLRDTAGLPEAHIRVLKDVARADMLDGIHEIAAKAGPKSRIWVYFSGHGAADPATGARMLLGDDTRAGVEAEKFAGYGLKVDEARAAAGHNGATVVMVVDACYTGQGRDGSDLTGGTRFALPSYASRSANSVEWAAAGAGQWATTLHPTRHGAFTWALLGALRGWADGSLDGAPDGVVTIAEADLSVKRTLEALGVAAQTPELTAGDGLAAMVVVPKGKTALERQPRLPKLTDAGPAPAPSAGFAFDGNLDVAGQLAQQACEETAGKRAPEQARAKVGPQIEKVRAEAAAAWANLEPQARACLTVADRKPCATIVEKFVTAGRSAKVDLPASVEVVKTDCGDRSRAVPAATLAVPIAEVAAAEALLVRLRSGTQAQVKVSAVVGPLVAVPAGKFTIGSPANEPGRSWEEGQAEVELSAGTYLMTTEFTVGMALAINGKPPDPAGGALPLTAVSWLDALAWANAASKAEGLKPCYAISGDKARWDRGCDGYRLPTEAEWEVAARAGAAHPAATPGPLDELAWTKTNAGGKVHPVGALAPNALGIHDALGNVWEWVWDVYEPGHAAGKDPQGPAEGVTHAYRGGCFASDARLAKRSGMTDDYRSANLGFRLARTVR